MSQSIIQKWEDSYRFTEEELGFFAESQKRLSKPLPQISEEDNNCTAHDAENEQDWVEEEISARIRKDLEASPKELSPRAAIILERLEGRYEKAHQMLNNLNCLLARIEYLQQSHEVVKSQSLVMQSLWDGLVTRQAEYGKVISDLEGMLLPYIQYEIIQKELLINDDVFSQDWLSSLEKASTHLNLLKEKEGHLDAPLYEDRYENITINSIKKLKSSLIAEIESITKLSSSQLRDANVGALGQVNAEFLITCTKLHYSIVTLSNCGVEGVDALQQVINRFLSCRSSILHVFFAHWESNKQSQTDEEEALVRLIELIHHVLGEERIIYDRLLNKKLSLQFDPHRKKSTESFLLSALKLVRSADERIIRIKNNQSHYSTLQSTLQSLHPSPWEEQKRVISILKEYFSPTVN